MYAAVIVTVGVERHGRGAVLLAGLARGEEVLAPVLDPLQRRTDLARREHDAHLVALHHDLLAEAATRVAHDDADAVLGEAEQPRAEQPHLVRRLRRGVDRELARRARIVDEQAAAFHRRGRVRLLVDRLGHDVRGAASASSSADAGRPASSPTTFEP